MYENRSFLQKNGLLIQNLRLGIHSDKIWADSTTKNTLEYLTTYNTTIGQNIWDI